MMEVPLKHSLHQIETLLGILWHMLLYLFFGTGLLASSSTPTSVFLRTTTLDDKTMTIQTVDDDGTDTMDGSDPRNVPDAEIMVTPINCLSTPIPGMSLSSFYPTLTQPFSRGRVELASADVGAHPRIIYPMLEDERDAVALRRATRFAMHLAERFETSGYPYPAPTKFGPGMDMEYLESLYSNAPDAENKTAGATSLDAGPAPSDRSSSSSNASSDAKARTRARKPQQLRRLNWRDVTDEDIDEYARRVCVTSLHFSSTCRMSLGPEDGVVDQRLRVHGLRNLRVADASVFPQIPSAHTMAPTVMVAERCAEFLKSEWAERKGK